MHLQSETEKMLAHALYSAGQTDREIADASHTSVNNVIWWRNEQGLSENKSAEAKARADEERYSHPFGAKPPSAPDQPRHLLPPPLR